MIKVQVYKMHEHLVHLVGLYYYSNEIVKLDSLNQ